MTHTHTRTLARLGCLSRSPTMILCNPNSVNTICRKQHPSHRRRGRWVFSLPLLQRYAAQSHPTLPPSLSAFLPTLLCLCSTLFCMFGALIAANGKLQRTGKVQRRQHKVESNQNRKQSKTHFINNFYRLGVHFEMALRASWLRFVQSFH